MPSPQILSPTVSPSERQTLTHPVSRVPNPAPDTDAAFFPSPQSSYFSLHASHLFHHTLSVPTSNRPLVLTRLSRLPLNWSPHSSLSSVICPKYCYHLNFSKTETVHIIPFLKNPKYFAYQVKFIFLFRSLQSLKASTNHGWWATSGSSPGFVYLMR